MQKGNRKGPASMQGLDACHPDCNEGSAVCGPCLDASARLGVDTKGIGLFYTIGQVRVTMNRTLSLTPSRFPYLNGLPRGLWRLSALCLLALTVRVVSADEYALDPSPMQPSGNKGEVPFEQPADSGACDLYLENLRYFARTNMALSCERPIAPRFQDRIRQIEWQDLK